MPETTLNLIFQWPTQPRCYLGPPLKMASEWAPNYQTPGRQSDGPLTTFLNVPGPHPVSSMLGSVTRTWTTSVGRGPKTWTQPDPFILCRPAIPGPTWLERQPQRWPPHPWFSGGWTPSTQSCCSAQPKWFCNLPFSTEVLIVIHLGPLSVHFIAHIPGIRYKFFAMSLFWSLFSMEFWLHIL